MCWKLFNTIRTIIIKELSCSIEIKNCNNIFLDQNYFSRHLGICNTRFELEFYAKRHEKQLIVIDSSKYQVKQTLDPSMS